MNKISNLMFLVVAVAALGAVGVTTTLMTAQAAPTVEHGQCHENGGSEACTGNGGGLVCNKSPKECHTTGPKP